MLSLHDATRRLPALANHMFVVGEGQRVDVSAFWWSRTRKNGASEALITKGL
jgi:hypothetical protein